MTGSHIIVTQIRTHHLTNQQKLATYKHNMHVQMHGMYYIASYTVPTVANWYLICWTYFFLKKMRGLSVVVCHTRKDQKSCCDLPEGKYNYDTTGGNNASSLHAAHRR